MLPAFMLGFCSRLRRWFPPYRRTACVLVDVACTAPCTTEISTACERWSRAVKGASRHSSSVWPPARRRTRLVDYPSHPAGLCSADLLCASSAVNHRLQQARHHGELQLLRSQVRFELCPAHDVGARRAHRTTCQCASPSALTTVARTTSTENVAPTLVWRRRAL